MINQHLDNESKYTDWIDNNEEYIIESYRESIEELDDVPDDFMNNLFESFYDEPDCDREED